jgi:hypothetical protein
MREVAMPVFIGVILGAFLTIAGAYLYDSSTGRAPNGLSASAAAGQAPMVNWAVVSERWRGLQAGAQDVAADVERGWKRLKG